MESLHQRGGPPPSKALSSLPRLTPQRRAVKRPSLHPAPHWAGTCAPGLLLSRWEGEEGLSSPFSFLPSSFPPRWVCSPRLLELFPSDLSSHWREGAFRHPLFPTRTPAVPLPKPANPALPLPPPLPRSPGRAWGADATDCRTRERGARSPRAPPAAGTPALRPRLRRPFGCSSQDGGRGAAAAPGVPVGPLPFSGPRRRKRGSGWRVAPHPPAR